MGREKKWNRLLGERLNSWGSPFNSINRYGTIDARVTYHRREIKFLEFALVKPRWRQIRRYMLCVLRQDVLAFLAEPR